MRKYNVGDRTPAEAARNWRKSVKITALGDDVVKSTRYEYYIRCMEKYWMTNFKLLFDYDCSGKSIVLLNPQWPVSQWIVGSLAVIFSDNLELQEQNRPINWEKCQKSNCQPLNLYNRSQSRQKVSCWKTCCWIALSLISLISHRLDILKISGCQTWW